MSTEEGKIKAPSIKELKMARDAFKDLLGHKNTKEKEWQKLFSTCPYILSNSLPLRMEPTDIRALGRPGKSEADLIFYPHNGSAIYSYGVIEIKTPQSPILTIPRKQIVALSRSAATAIQQANEYNKRLQKSLIRSDETLIIGAMDYIFIIMGMSLEIERKIISGMLYEQFNALLPKGCQIIPYDSLLKMFSSSIPLQIYKLSPIKISNTDEQQKELISLGSAVMIKRGPLAGMTGRLERTRQDPKPWVAIEMFGKKVLCSIAWEALKKMEGRELRLYEEKEKIIEYQSASKNLLNACELYRQQRKNLEELKSDIWSIAKGIAKGKDRDKQIYLQKAEYQLDMLQFNNERDEIRREALRIIEEIEEFAEKDLQG